MQLPLQGKNILVTREASLADKFSKQLIAKGANVLETPLLKIACKRSLDDREVIENLGQFNWIFFTSVNGVECFFNLIEKYEIKLPVVKIAVVGHKTEEVLKSYGFVADFIPSIYDGENLVNEFLGEFHDIGKVLLVQGNRSRKVIADGLLKAGVDYRTIVVYETLYNEEAKAKLNRVLKDITFDYVTFTSPSTVEAFMKYSKRTLSNDTKVVCIGNTTEKKAREFGLTNISSPNLFTIEAMIELMCNEKRED
ncbi:uroporphyrinogen-III synthase [Ornithinibacillus californiensis]|uniref:uroporphyrinogen-III synthase n=1 Tax=Ornithinibacillus californiensis TaxID=161536 RepID=UPI00064D8C2F|nr:uroporphyrinogen-III synthase [Ornithinibacillus californiensis]